AGEGEVEDFAVDLAAASSLQEIVSNANVIGNFQLIVSGNGIQLVSNAKVLVDADRSDISGITANRPGSAPARAGATLAPGVISVGASGKVFRLADDASLDLPSLGGALQGIDQIDLTGGEVLLTLDLDAVRDVTDGEALKVLSDQGDTILIGVGWSFDRVVLDGGDLVRVITQDGVTVSFDGFEDYTNPIDPFDVNRDGDLSASDPLAIINELRRRAFSDNDGGVLDPSTVDLAAFRFYDTNRDLRITSLDALRAINELGRRFNTARGQGERVQALISRSDVEKPSRMIEAAPQLETIKKEGSAVSETPPSVLIPNASPSVLIPSASAATRPEAATAVESIDALMLENDSWWEW
ncbi:MAG: dockerin type I domain-containing protein, partial [Pirellulales bacterium]|nr:dockerin type I domain-containing protein [Pirellulales bacterium]